MSEKMLQVNIMNATAINISLGRYNFFFSFSPIRRLNHMPLTAVILHFSIVYFAAAVAAKCAV